MLLQGRGGPQLGTLNPRSKMELPTSDTYPLPPPFPVSPPYPGPLGPSPPLVFLFGQLGINREGGAHRGQRPGREEPLGV